MRCTQAGQVLFPDTAFKVAQCINDFSREGIPIMILVFVASGSCYHIRLNLGRRLTGEGSAVDSAT